MPDLRAFPAPAWLPRRVVVLSPGGSQGGAFASQALANAAAGGFRVTLHPRDPQAFLRNAQVRCGPLGGDIARHPRADVSSGALDVDPACTLVIDPTVVGGLCDTIARTPVGSRVAYSQNGLPSHAAEKAARRLQAHTLVSAMSSARAPGRGVTVAPGGTVLVGESDSLVEAIRCVLRDRGFFRLQTVPDIEAARHEKVALNCAVNVTTTLFGITLGQLLDQVRRDPRCERLVGGLAAEACAVAAAQGIRLPPADRVVAGIHAAMHRLAAHRTSMRAAFDAGAPTEIGVLNAGICRLGDAVGVATPLNRLVTGMLASFESRRDADGTAPGGFHCRHAGMVAAATEHMLDAAARLG